MRTHIALAFAALSFSSLAQENRIVIEGTIHDSKTRAPLSSASVVAPSRELEVISNEEGKFRIIIPGDAANDSLTVSHVGYKTLKKKLSDLKSPVLLTLEDYSIELRTVTVKSRALSLKDIDKGLRPVRGNLYAFETETTNGLYNLFLDYLEDQPELLRQCTYDLSGQDEKMRELMKEYTMPFKKPLNKKDTTRRNYTDFPAVAIPHEAAVIFCQWLTQQYNSNPGKKKFAQVKFRLPTLKEWQIAALGYAKFQSWNLDENSIDIIVSKDSLNMLPIKGDRRTVPVSDVWYPWYNGYYYRKSPQNHKGCFLGNFNVTHVSRVCDYTRTAYDGWKMMAQTATYFPNDMGLYDVAGNVAEMIDEKGKACGGSWNDLPENSTIHSVKTYKKPDASIGFRIFMEVVQP
jgi:hypothetical protein